MKKLDELSENRVPRPCRKLRQDWAGGLREFRDKYASVELQHKVLDWRVETALMNALPGRKAAGREPCADGRLDFDRTDRGRETPGEILKPG